MAEIQITNRETLSERKFPLKYFTYQKPDADNKMQSLKAEVYFRPDAVGILLYDTERSKFLLTKQFRLPAYLNGSDTGYLVEVCAGLIDEGETPEETAIREAFEETGYEITDVKKIAAAYTSAGGITEYIHLYLAAYNPSLQKSKGGGLEEEGENIELIELDFEQARQMLKNQEFRDAKTIMLLQHYFLFC
ncbi:NUDIX domain-containing protein [Mucilaginibacter sp. Bleaf8]|uniref:NUDIX domain-containing protein n=1 Tax=Mucilaginibacter sp. Bleaf8 TaxID=2834430 RepID=UPI001BCAAD6F|nr:NUDIX domain-containing protein [Mucilaginibacter sp. Bleaf8]MBS7563654.1 NUDIX domain-containing protein [Mucilaginibacter sp. Bleaf8]